MQTLYTGVILWKPDFSITCIFGYLGWLPTHEMWNLISKLIFCWLSISENVALRASFWFFFFGPQLGYFTAPYSISTHDSATTLAKGSLFFRSDFKQQTVGAIFSPYIFINLASMSILAPTLRPGSRSNLFWPVTRSHVADAVSVTAVSNCVPIYYIIIYRNDIRFLSFRLESIWIYCI